MRPLVIPICIALTVAVASAADNWPHFRSNGGVVDDDPAAFPTGGEPPRTLRGKPVFPGWAGDRPSSGAIMSL